MRLGGLKKFFSRDTDKKDEKLEIEIKTEERDIEQEKQALEQERLEEKERQQALIDEENAREVAEVHQICAGKEKDKVWAFCAGQYSNDFRGNPKYLFLYINNYRKDIVPYWLCDDVELIEMIRGMGFHAYRMGTPQAETIISYTGVLVSEQVKAFIPDGLEQAKYLNLWHGVGGVKVVERKIKEGRLLPELAKKYIARNEYYRTYELYLAPSAFIENIAKAELGLTEKQIVRAGYPRCLYQANYKKIETYDHDLIGQKGLPEDTKIVAYTPTYRNNPDGELFSKAIPDIDRIIEVCEKEHLLMIFKMHPLLEKEQGFLWAKQRYADCKWLLFWDNTNDFYEILDKIDLCIMDYSSIFTDFIAAGCKHFLRYAFDFDNDDLDFPMDYDEVTPGRKCKNFDELVQALSEYEKDDISDSLDRISKLYWEYSTSDSMDKIIDSTIAFVPEKVELPTLYSFDIFDTLFSRKVLDPVGIFYYVQEKMQEDGGFPRALVLNYLSIRKTSEANVREYYNKSIALRESEKVEIQFDEIFARMASVYNLTDEQVQKLKAWELECEYDNVIPLPEQIDMIKKYLAQKDTVILVSDMYLPKDVILEMLRRAEPMLTELPLYLSCEYGVQKVSQQLFFEVFASFEPYYDFKKWVHYGDNPIADHNPPRKIGIEVRQVAKPEFSDIQTQLVEQLGTYDSYLVAALQTRMAAKAVYTRDEFVSTFVTICMVPYVDWALRDAIRRGYQTLYFISRDGHPLKRIADAIIEARGLNVKTKYIYASRRTWRIPSFIHEVDREFWEPYGSFGNITSKDKLLKAMDLTDRQFRKFFPAVVLDGVNFTDKKVLNGLIDIFKKSESYNQYLMKKGAEERVLVSRYLEQEIDRTEKFAFVEYWGRGYTQDCFVRLWHDIVGEEVDVPYYYSRTVLPTIGHSVRYNFTTNNTAQFFMEGIFANMPYKSIEKYQVVDGKVEPVIVPVPHDTSLFDSMQRLLPEFAYQYAKLPLHTPEDTDRMLYEFALNYYRNNLENEEFAEQIGGLVDSISLYGKKREFAPPFTMKMLDSFASKEKTRGMGSVTTSITMSVTRASEEVKRRYFEMYQIMPGDGYASGRLLSEGELEENRKYKEKYEEIKERAERFAELYDEASDVYGIENKIVFVTNAKNFTSGYLGKMAEMMKAHKKLSVVLLRMGNTKKTDEEIAAIVASARYIIVPAAIHLFCRTSFRMGTDMIMLRDNAFNLYNQGYEVRYFLKWKQKYFDYVLNNDTDILQVPSEHQRAEFDKQFSPKEMDREVLYGNCSTDMYFDKDFISEAKQKLQDLFPETADRKVILYMPTLRRVNSSSIWARIFNMQALSKLIGDKYCVVVSLNAIQSKNGFKNELEVEGFSKCINKNNGMTIRALMVASDVIVGDYRDSFFETTILRKPAYSTAYDYEKIIKGLNMSLHANAFDQNLFCPIVRTEQELADQLKQIDHYDYQKMDQFREKMFANCDGHSMERVRDYLLAHYKDYDNLVTKDEQKKNKEFYEKYQELKKVADEFAEAYELVVPETDIVDQIVLLSERALTKNDPLFQLKEYLKEQKISCKVLMLDQKKTDLLLLARELATARYIVTSKPVSILCRCELREETEQIMLPELAFSLYKKELQAVDEIRWKRKGAHLAAQNPVSVLQIPSEGQEDLFRKTYSGNGNVYCGLKGSCNTDQYFDQKLIEESRNALMKLIPELNGRKIILYMPSWRKDKETRKTAMLSLSKMQTALQDKYMVVLHFDQAGQKEKDLKQYEIPGFCKVLEKEIPARRLLMAADVIVGDYSALFFESVLLGKPMYSSAYDYETFIEKDSIQMTAEEFANEMFCPIVKSAEDLVNEIRQIESYDYQKLEVFRKDVFADCDGNSVRRVAEYLQQQR